MCTITYKYINYITMKLKVKLNCPDGKLPTYGSDYAAGLDLYSCLDYKINPGSRECVSTGIALEWIKNNESEEHPEEYYLRIAPRSGLALKNGIDVLAGVIDYDYRGEIKIILINTSDKEFIVNKGDRVAQAILTKIIRFEEILNVDSLDESVRGENGFGSTGKS